MPKGIRQLRRWARTTPNGQIGMTMVGVVCVCVLVAAILVGIKSHWL